MTSFAPALKIKDRRHDSRPHGLSLGAEPRALVLLKSRRPLAPEGGSAWRAIS